MLRAQWACCRPPAWLAYWENTLLLRPVEPIHGSAPDIAGKDLANL
jgi:hypothetical protein